MPVMAGPESKVKPAVVADAGLATVLKEWAAQDKKTSGFFAKVCDYAKKHKLSRPVIEATLKTVRPDWAKSTYASEISRILLFTKKENEGLLEDMLSGKKTANQARAEATKKQLRPKKGADTKLTEKIETAAKFAAVHAKEILVDVSEIDQEDEEAVNEANESAKEGFLEQCGTAFDEALIRTPLFASEPEGTITEEGESEGEEEGEEEEEGEDTK
jgi:hypothetical protein